MSCKYASMQIHREIAEYIFDSFSLPATPINIIYVDKTKSNKTSSPQKLCRWIF